MHLVLLHGYLLQGTGSNIYVANVARAWSKLGHGVTVICQDPEAKSLSFVNEYFSPGDSLPASPPAAGIIRVVVPFINNLLPVYVVDKYEGFQVKTIPQMTKLEIETHIRLTAKAVAQVAKQGADRLLANHVFLGPVIAKRGLDGTGIPYDVKIHGSAMEYTLVPHPELMPYAIEGLASAKRLFVGTQYVRDRVLEVFSNEHHTLKLDKKLAIVPPGMDPEIFKRSEDFQKDLSKFRLKVAQRVRKYPNGRIQSKIPPYREILSAPDLNHRLVTIGETYDQRATDADLLKKWPDLEEDEPIIMYFGKFLPAKGVGEFLLTLPTVLSHIPQARFIFVGFGTYREHLEGMIQALAAGDLPAFEQFSRAGDFVEQYDFSRWFRKLTPAELGRITVTGILDHETLQYLLPLASLSVVPSKWPEAFGMVAVEAMAAGVLSLCNYHAGLKDVVDEVSTVDPSLADLMRLERETFVEQLPGKIKVAVKFLYPHGFSDHRFRQQVGKKLRQISVDNFSWEGIAKRLLP